MKSALLAAAAVGTALAALILYYQKRLKLERNMLSTGHDDFHSLNNETDEITRSAHHAMG